MRNLDFFQEIEHTPIPWGDKTIYVPVFYYDTTRLNVLFMAPQEKLRALLPSTRMHPIRITPWHGTLAISAMEFRDTDIGPYNEVSISIPFALDRPSPLFTGILRKGAAEPLVYIHHLPVTTEIARDLGIEFAGYPKFLAKIEFEREGDWVTCNLSEKDHHILNVSVQKIELQPAIRSRINYFTARNGRLLRSASVAGMGLTSMSRDRNHMQLKLGDHPIAQELKEIGLGKMLVCQYIQGSQSTLSPALESFAE